MSRIARLGARWLSTLAVAVIGALVLGEALLWLGSLFVEARPVASRPGASFRILALGDSHTYGAGLEDHESYPAQLQALLDARHPSEYSVINLGVPGMSTTQVRDRLALNVTRYRPDLVVFWCGVNNVWNRTEVDAGARGVRARLQALGQRSRLYRLARIALHDRVTDTASAATRTDGRRQASEREEVVGEETTVEFWEGDQVELHTGRHRHTTWTLHHGGVTERIEHLHAPGRAGEQMRERVTRDLRAMIGWLREAGVPVILVRYPRSEGAFGPANRGIQLAAEAEGVSVIDSALSLARIPRAEWTWLYAGHPSARTYGEVAKDLLPVVEAVRANP